MLPAALWVLMMLAWLGGLILAAWGIWPLLQNPPLSADLVIPLLWLSIGATAWIVAFDFGRRRFWRR